MKNAFQVLCMAAALAAAGLLAGCGQGGAKTGPAASAAKAQTNCPVMGGKIDKSVFADHEGKRVYFCCPDCVNTFTKDPQKYIKKLEDAGITVAKTPGKGG